MERPSRRNLFEDDSEGDPEYVPGQENEFEDVKTKAEPVQEKIGLPSENEEEYIP